jgi:hypothetical protein
MEKKEYENADEFYILKGETLQGDILYWNSEDWVREFDVFEQEPATEEAVKQAKQYEFKSVIMIKDITEYNEDEDYWDSLEVIKKELL